MEYGIFNFLAIKCWRNDGKMTHWEREFNGKA
jgi:hypothetical protein